MNTVCEVVKPEVEAVPRLCIVKVDETAKWMPEIAGRAKRVLGVYLFDATSRACGEAAPEYECLFVGSQFDNPALSDREANWLAWEVGVADDQADPVRFISCGEIDALPHIEEGDLTEGVIDLGTEDVDEAFEYLRLRSV